MAEKCRKCFGALIPCSSCKGGKMLGKLTCRACNNTGFVCHSHGGYWE